LLAGCALHIYAFGEGRVIRDGQAVRSSEWRGLLNKELFFYILLHGPLRRDAISVVFWPNSPPQKVRNSFSTAIRHIRDALGDKDAVMVEKVEGQQGLYWIKEDRWFDIDEFGALIGMARHLPPGQQAASLWERAANLYQGDFLPEAEREWCVSVRARLWEMYLDSLIQVGQYHEVRQDFDQAIRWYRQALDEEDRREDVHRGLIRCYLGAGRRHEALSQYRRCEKRLWEARLEPSPETKALYEQIVGKR
jgi:DNA-binding SARP family transcriptional activator